jgi:uncharacterized protein YrrD
MEIISVSDASKLGFVDSLFLNLSSQHVLGLRTRTGGITTQYRAILLRDVKAMGRHVVTVEDPSKIGEAGRYPELQGSAETAVIIGARVVTEDGTVIGTAADIDFDPQSGAIQHYILATGMLERLRRTERTVPVGAVRSVSANLIVVRNEAAAGLVS